MPQAGKPYVSGADTSTRWLDCPAAPDRSVGSVNARGPPASWSRQNASPARRAASSTGTRELATCPLALRLSSKVAPACSSTTVRRCHESTFCCPTRLPAAAQPASWTVHVPHSRDARSRRRPDRGVRVHLTLLLRAACRPRSIPDDRGSIGATHGGLAASQQCCSLSSSGAASIGRMSSSRQVTNVMISASDRTTTRPQCPGNCQACSERSIPVQMHRSGSRGHQDGCSGLPRHGERVSSSCDATRGAGILPRRPDPSSIWPGNR
jgi:hypothetical protein